MVPRHAHDCGKCRLVMVTKLADWYVCGERRSLGHSIVGRYGKEPHAYWSMPSDVLSTIPADHSGSAFETEALSVLATT